MKCDLHIHSSYSFDSFAQPKKIVDAAAKKGLGCIAIADHGNMKGSLEAQKYSRAKSVIIIPCEEVKSKQGDILAFNIKSPIPEHLSAKETIELIHKQGGFAVAAHPFGWECGFKGNLEDYLGLIDGVEILNASIFGKGNEKARAFAQKNNLAFTVGSDAHFTNHFIGKAWLELPLEYSPSLTPKDIIDLIKKKKGAVGGKAANFFEKAIDHPFRTMAKLKALAR